MALLPGIPATPVSLNITVREGATFLLSGILRVTAGGAPVDLTGMTVRAKIRLNFTQAAVRAFTCALSGTPTDGTFTITMTVANAAKLGGAWATGTVYAANDLTTANGALYRCTTGGTSAGSGTGPSGTGTAITDNTVTWTHVSTVPDGSRTFQIGEWDLEIDDGASVGRFVEGTVTYSREATT